MKSGRRRVGDNNVKRRPDTELLLVSNLDIDTSMNIVYGRGRIDVGDQRGGEKEQIEYTVFLTSEEGSCPALHTIVFPGPKLLSYGQKLEWAAPIAVFRV